MLAASFPNVRVAFPETSLDDGSIGRSKLTVAAPETHGPGMAPKGTQRLAVPASTWTVMRKQGALAQVELNCSMFSLQPTISVASGAVGSAAPAVTASTRQNTKARFSTGEP